MGTSRVTPELHVAGATVIHESPFSGLDVPVSTSSLATDLRQEWVLPIYGKWWNDPRVTANYLRTRYAQISPDLVRLLLAEFDWRPRVAGAFLAALCPLPELEDHIGRLLLRSDVCYAGAEYCLALTRFNTPSASAYLCEYLGYYLQRVDLCFDQGEALAALMHLDAVNGRNDADVFMPLWQSVIADKPRWSLQQSVSVFQGRFASVTDIAALLTAQIAT